MVFGASLRLTDEKLVLFVLLYGCVFVCRVQVMVFVHARNATVKTALTLREMAANQGDSALFQAKQSAEYGAAEKQVTSPTQLPSNHTAETRI